VTSPMGGGDGRRRKIEGRERAACEECGGRRRVKMKMKPIFLHACFLQGFFFFFFFFFKLMG
jgi:hypothetical protein